MGVFRSAALARSFAADDTVHGFSCLESAAVKRITGLVAGLAALAALPCLAAGGRPMQPSAEMIWRATVGTLPADKDLKAFIGQAMAADAITDPLQRCLRFPDPPGTRWTPQVVTAYCRYMTVPAAVPAAEAKQLLHAHRGKELDRRLAAADAAAKASADARNRFDRMFLETFNVGTASMRADLDAWKRTSPRSAFAFAASGIAYEAQAEGARGTDTIDKTSAGQLKAMDGWLRKARADLESAHKFDPRFVPTYTGMIWVTQFGGDTPSLERAAEAGLEQDASNYAIFDAMMSAADPKWGGSLRQMQQVGQRALAHAAGNPLLRVLATKAGATGAGITPCGCDLSRLPDLRKVFSEISQAPMLIGAGRAASRLYRPDQAVPFQFQNVRFESTAMLTRSDLVFELMKVGDVPAATTMAERCVGKFPRYPRCYEARGAVHAVSGQLALAEQDWRRAMELDPKDGWATGQLGQLYVGAGNWDGAWRLSQQLIRMQPERPDGWILRAAVQSMQPRPGLRDTQVYLVTHFGNDPTARPAVQQARSDLARSVPAQR